MDRREQRRLQTREQLLDAAQKVFSELGFQQASILDITEAANVSKRTFYLHFTDKDALIEALAYRHFEEVQMLIQAEKQDGLPHREQHQRAMQVLFEYASHHPDLMQTLFGQDASYKLNAMTRTYVVQAMERQLGEHCTFYKDAVVPQVVVAQASAGVIFQLLCWWVQNASRYSPSEMAQMCTSVLFDGIGVNFDEITLPSSPHSG